MNDKLVEDAKEYHLQYINKFVEIYNSTEFEDLKTTAP